jgi:hypothetical protein
MQEKIVQDFFNSYAAALQVLDMQKLMKLHHLPCIVMDKEKFTPFTSIEQIHEFYTKAFDKLFKHEHIQNFTLQILRLRVISSSLVITEANIVFYNKKHERVLGFTGTFNLLCKDESCKIIVINIEDSSIFGLDDLTHSKKAEFINRTSNAHVRKAAASKHADVA